MKPCCRLWACVHNNKSRCVFSRKLTQLSCRFDFRTQFILYLLTHCVYVCMCVLFSMQRVLLGIFLVPVRAILLSLVLMVTWPVALIITFKRPLKGAVEPMTGWRR